jgi:GYF domain 2
VDKGTSNTQMKEKRNVMGQLLRRLDVRTFKQRARLAHLTTDSNESSGRIRIETVSVPIRNAMNWCHGNHAAGPNCKLTSDPWIYHHSSCKIVARHFESWLVPVWGKSMSARWFYEIDGREGGPISTVQLQLMANSGMLQPQHKIRKENSEQWSVAGEVRGLFAPSQPTPANVPQAYPVNRPVPMATPVAAVPPPAENPMGWPAETPSADPAAAAFDFFSESTAPAVAMPPPAAKAKAGRKPRLPVNASTPPMTEEENPFSFGEESAPAQPAAVPAPAVSVMPARPMTPAPVRASADNPFEFEGAATDAPMLPQQPAMPNLAPPPVSPPPRTPAHKKSTPAQTMTTPAGGTPSVVVEVTGQAVELLPGDEVRLLEGSTMFRLHRAWVYVATKLADETTHTTYLPLQRIDAAILDQRFEAGRKKSEPHSLLIFHSGAVAAGLVFQGSDKAYRNFLEKVLLLANPTKHSGGK